MNPKQQPRIKPKSDRNQKAWNKVLKIAEKHFKGNSWKFSAWIGMSNHLLEWRSPFEMYEAGQSEKLLEVATRRRAKLPAKGKKKV